MAPEVPSGTSGLPPGEKRCLGPGAIRVALWDTPCRARTGSCNASWKCSGDGDRFAQNGGVFGDRYERGVTATRLDRNDVLSRQASRVKVLVKDAELVAANSERFQQIEGRVDRGEGGGNVRVGVRYERVRVGGHVVDHALPWGETGTGAGVAGMVDRTMDAEETGEREESSWASTLITCGLLVVSLIGVGVLVTRNGGGTVEPVEGQAVTVPDSVTTTTDETGVYDPNAPSRDDWEARHAWAAQFEHPANRNLSSIRTPGNADYISGRDWGFDGQSPAHPSDGNAYEPTAADLEAAARAWALGDNGDDMPDRYHMVGETFTYRLIEDDPVTPSEWSLVDDAFAWVSAAGGWTFTEADTDTEPVDLTVIVNSTRCTCVLHPDGTPDGYAATAEIHVQPNSTIENTYQELFQAVGPGGDWGPAGQSIIYDSGDRGPYPEGVSPALAPTVWDAWVISLNRILPDAPNLDEARTILQAAYPNAP